MRCDFAESEVSLWFIYVDVPHHRFPNKIFWGEHFVRVHLQEMRFVYTVRLPRPEGNALQESETLSLEATMQLKQERIEYLTAAMRVKQVCRKSRRFVGVCFSMPVR